MQWWEEIRLQENCKKVARRKLFLNQSEKAEQELEYIMAFGFFLVFGPFSPFKK